jgi:hypothetical protein
MVTAMNAQAEDAAKAKALMLMQASRKDVLSREEVTHARTHALAHAYKHAHSRALGAGAPDEAGGRGNTPTAARAEDSSETLPPPPLTCTRTPCSTHPAPSSAHSSAGTRQHVCDTVALAVAARVVVLRVYAVCACRARRPRGSQARQRQQSRTSWRR